MAFIRLQLRRDTAANWTSANPTLAEGEIGIETDTGQFKIGNGSDAWDDLIYAGIEGDTGPAGADGKTILSGAVDPTTEGANGDFYINTATSTLFGPKASGTWPSGVLLIGADGADGADGVGVPVGGTTGQALIKSSNTDYATEWGTVASSPGGSDTFVQFNDGGAFGGDAGLVFNKTTNALTIDDGTLNMTGSSSGTVTIQPAAAAGTYTLTLPTNDGDAGQFLKTDGSGVLSWDAAGGGSPGGSDTQVQFNDGGSFGGDADFTWDKTNNVLTLGTDARLRRRGAANFAFGAADAAAPVAQTLSVQSVVAGTTNTAGANLTITGSQGTGTGAGGSIIFQTAPAGSSGTAQNALATTIALTQERSVILPTGGALAFSNTTDGTIGTNGITFFYDGVFTDSSVLFVRRTGQTTNLYGFGYSGINLGTARLGFGPNLATTSQDLILIRDAANTLAQRNGANAQESRVYGSYTAADNFQRMSIKTLRESSGALSGATYVTTIAIPAYANLIGVTTRVTTAVTGATTYDVGDGSDVDLWGAAIGVALGSQSRTADFTAVAAVGAAATSRTVTLTANGSNFTGGVVEICLHYLTTEAD
jgi:hypothetical protein